MARDAPQIDAYGDGGFRLSTGRHEGSLLIVRDEARTWPVRAMSDLAPEHFAEIIEAGRSEVEFVLLGAGQANALPPRAVRDALQRAGIGLEFMDTATACRTYNILTAAGRKLAAALIAV
ncbi:MAG: Mth938-like domain-containing protein [Phenylobacterium sp.]